MAAPKYLFRHSLAFFGRKAILFRNLASRDGKECIRGNPMNGVAHVPPRPKVLKKGPPNTACINDGRISRAADGMVTRRASTDAAAGGTLLLKPNIDKLELDVASLRLQLEMSVEVLAERCKPWCTPAAPRRGLQNMYVQTVQQTHLGSDLDFGVGSDGAGIARDFHGGLRACQKDAYPMPTW